MKEVSTTNTANNERGTATLTAVMIMGLLALFAAASLSRVTTEALVMGNDYAHSKSFFAAQASLELMSRDFERVFDVQLRPTPTDIERIKNSYPNIEGFTFNQNIEESDEGEAQPIGGDSPFSGLISLRTPWRITSVATYSSGAQVQLTRTFFNHQIPIFQFGIFYEDNMELHPGPRFDFGGRVHSNGHMFLAAGGGGLWFRSRVTAVREVVRDVVRNGLAAGPGSGWTGTVSIMNQSGQWKELLPAKGSVIGGPDINNSDADMPNGSNNNNWSADSTIFTGNLLARQRPLRLPLTVGTDNDPIEIIKRGQGGDDDILRDSRFYNQQGLRVTLADKQNRLPGGAGGVRLDMKDAGDATDISPAGTRGYLPRQMVGLPRATRFNGWRTYTGTSYDGNPHETWIKIEMVVRDPATLAPVATDITADILSLGFTERSNILNNDLRAIFKLQRYEVFGPPIKVARAEIQNGNAVAATFTNLTDPRTGTSKPVYSYNNTGNVTTSSSYVATSRLVNVGGTNRWLAENATNRYDAANAALREGTADSALQAIAVTPFETQIVLGGNTLRVIPFPIKLFDTREGIYNDDLATAGAAPSWEAFYTSANPVVPSPANPVVNSSRVPVTGVMSIIDIDMFNFGRFLNGTWNGLFPANLALPGGSLSSDDLPDNGGAGWIIYVSDRRGDRDNDGEYDMENVYITNNNQDVLQNGEDVNNNGALDIDYTWESRRYYSQTETFGGTNYDVASIESDVAAVNGLSGGGNGLHVYADRYFRRGTRIINGAVLSGNTNVGGINAAMPGTLNRGFSITSENGIYIQGNLNATGIAAVGTPSQPNQYNGPEVPFGVMADAVTILSRNWQDGQSFRNPFRHGYRNVTAANETHVRTALLMGDSKSSLLVAGVPNQGGGDRDLSGGVHNFPRFLENWGGTRLNYCGSLINLFNSRGNAGAFKCCVNVYGAPTRNWVFNTAFLDINRLPPGTPFFQYVQMTGFRQTVRQLQ